MDDPPDRDGNVADLLRAAADRFGSRAAVITTAGVRSWSDLDAAADTGVRALADLRLPPGTRVVIGLPTGPDLLAVLFAVARAGLVAVPVGPARAPFAEVLDRTGAALIVSAFQPNAGRGDHLTGPPSGPVHWPASRPAGWWGDALTDERVGVVGGGEDLAQLARAASSEQPVMLSHRAVISAAAAVAAAPGLGLRSQDRVIQVLPLYHPAGWISSFLPLTTVGAAAVLPELPEERGGWIDAVLAAVREHRVTIIPGAPSLYRRLRTAPEVERSLATVRLMTSGAAPLDREDFAAVRAHTGQAVREGYGISEAAAAVASSLMTPTARPGSVGLPLAGVEVRIIEDHDENAPDADALDADATDEDALTDDPSDQDLSDRETPNESTEPAGRDADGTATPSDSGAQSAPQAESDPESRSGTDAPSEPDRAGEPGQPAEPDRRAGAGSDRAAGRSATSGRDTDAAPGSVGIGEVGPIAVRGDTLFSGYWPDGAGGPGPDGWFLTGDVGYLDDFGELHLVDRAAEALVVAGFTVYPREVEDVLTAHPYIRDAAVVGVPGRSGEIMLAVLVGQRGTHPTPADVDDFVAERLPPFKRPARYRLVARLPRTEVGRVDRAAVRRAYLADPDPEPVPVRLTAAGAGSPAGEPLPARPGQSGPASDEELF